MEFNLPKDNTSIIKVIGVGGGGSNAVNHMYRQQVQGVDFIVCNTDKQALDSSPVPHKILLGESLTEGRGAGSIPEVGKNAAIESIEKVKEVLFKNTKMVFITAGMGGGTGTGAAPEIARTALEEGILTVGIVTSPFNFEGPHRRKQAEIGIDEMRKNVDALLIVNNERLREIGSTLPITNVFAIADDILTIATKGISHIIHNNGLINRDFNDVNTIMRRSGVAIMGSASAEGENRAIKATQMALSSPLLNDNDIKGAKHVLLYITYGNTQMTGGEMFAISDYIQEETGGTAELLFGTGVDPSLNEKVDVTIIATGFETAPITGFEKETEPQKIELTKEPKVEIIKPLMSPVETNKKPTQNTFSFPNKAKNEERSSSVQPKTEATVTQFNWEMSAPTLHNPSAKTEKIEQQRFNLIDDVYSTTSENNRQTIERQEPRVSSEEQQQRIQDRMAKIHEVTSKLKRPEFLSQFEKEPAYVRRKLTLNNESIFSADDQHSSRMSIDTDEYGNSKVRTNNSFLHDNVD